MKERKKICLYIGSMSLGGIGKLMINLMEEFIIKDIGVDLFLMKNGGEYYDQIPDGVRVFIKKGSHLKRIKAFVDYLNKEQPDYVISARQRQDIGNIISCFIARGKSKPVISIHTNVSKENEIDASGKRNNILLRLASKTLYKYPKKFIAVSQGVKKDFSNRTGIGMNKIEVIHNPSYKKYEDELDQKLREKYQHIIPEKQFIIAVGRLTKAKDYPTLIKAFKLVRDKRDVNLLILGDGELKKELENLIKQLNLQEHIFLLGFIDYPQFFLKRAKLFVMTSQWEGFGNVIVEALGVGTPVVSTNCPSGPAEILNKGKYGELVPVGDYQALSEAMLNSLNKNTDKNFLIERARHFSTSKIANQYLAYIFNESEK